ncbi:MFS general substrate transporter [Lactarius sanguifluus]|nr:MFS general substrate transporter [Lactarius sanguifluus]
MAYPTGGGGVTGSELSFTRWLFAFSLVTTLFFTWGFSYGLLDVLNAHFQQVFGITKLQSTMLQLAYFGAYIVFSPFAGVFMRRFGYKKGIHLGLTLYSLGAIFFWPSAKFAKYGGFVGCTFVIGCGLSCLEVAANSYITVLGTPRYAAMRLNISQGFQGNANTLDTVQWVYLAVSGLGVLLNVLFYFCDLPEITEEALTRELVATAGEQAADVGPFYKQYRCVFGFVAQTCYVGAQVGVASFTVNYLVDQGVGISHSHASLMFAFCQLTFTGGRFIGAALLRFVDTAFLLTTYGVACMACCLGVALSTGDRGIASLYLLFFFESICYPCIFTLGTRDLGPHTKRGSSLIVMGVGGGAWFPSAQGALADNAYTRRSYLVPFAGYTAMTAYAIGLVVNEAAKSGFDFTNRDTVAETMTEASWGKDGPEVYEKDQASVGKGVMAPCHTLR